MPARDRESERFVCACTYKHTLPRNDGDDHMVIITHLFFFLNVDIFFKKIDRSDPSQLSTSSLCPVSLSPWCVHTHAAHSHSLPLGVATVSVAAPRVGQAKEQTHSSILGCLQLWEHLGSSPDESRTLGSWTRQGRGEERALRDQNNRSCFCFLGFAFTFAFLFPLSFSFQSKA